MSRHTVKHPTKENKTLVYGYDRPLSEYFWQEWEGKDAEFPADSSILHGERTGAELCEKLQEYGMSAEDSHYCTAMMDMPIEQEPNTRNDQD